MNTTQAEQSLQAFIKAACDKRTQVHNDIARMKKELEAMDKRKREAVRYASDMITLAEKALHDIEESVHDADRLSVILPELVEVINAIDALCAKRNALCDSARIHRHIDSHIRTGLPFSTVHPRLGYDPRT